MNSHSTSLETPRAAITRPDQSQRTHHPREQFILPKLQEAVTQAISESKKTLPSEAKILDIGCGRQPYRTLLQTGQFQYFSFDVEQNEEKTVDFLGYIDQPLPPTLVQSGPYDLIILTEVLEHVFDLEKCFSNLVELLSPAGKMILTCPFFFPLHEKPYDFWRMSPFAIEQLCKKFNLEVLEYRRLGSSLECWGLLNGHLLTHMQYQTPRNWVDRIKLSLQQRLLRWFLKLNWNLVRKGALTRYFSQDQDFYVSNYFLLKNNRKRPPEGSVSFEKID